MSQTTDFLLQAQDVTACFHMEEQKADKRKWLSVPFRASPGSYNKSYVGR